jgi:hypothetical protein
MVSSEDSSYQDAWLLPNYALDLKKLTCHKNGAELLVLAIWANKSKMYLEQPILFVAISSILPVLGHGRPEINTGLGHQMNLFLKGLCREVCLDT